MNIKKILTRTMVLTVVFFSLISCDNDFKELGSSLVDHNDFQSLLYADAEIQAHTIDIDRVQSNGLSSYALGYYKDGKFGNTTTNILTQLSLSNTAPTFGDSPELDSVVLTIPYFSHEVEETAEGKKYELDSIYGENPIKLSIYRSNFFLRDVDPSTDLQSQIYYSDDGDKFEQNLESSPIYETPSFIPSNKEVKVVKPSATNTGELDTLGVSPRMRIHLPVAYFKNAIIDQEGTSNLESNQGFQDYFRGLYFKAAAVNGEGNLSLLNLKSDEAKITLYYSNTKEDEDGEEQTTHHSFDLNFGNQIVNVFDTENNNPSFNPGDLYVRGGAGAMTVVNLFSDPAQLDSLRNTDWLINEANLKFYVNQDDLPADYENPQRIMIYDVKNHRVLDDYSLDQGENENDLVNSRTTHLGKLTKDDDGNLYYKIRITNYLNELIDSDSTNTKLGIVVSQNVNNSDMTTAQLSGSNISKIPSSEVLARNGTVFYGPQSGSDKALRLEIYYTKPE